MDHTQPTRDQAPTPKAILVTLLALTATNIGQIAGTFAHTVGHLTPYASTTTGAGAAAATFTISMGIAKFIRSNDHQ